MFLLLLCNDRAVLGPWVNSTARNLFTAAVVWVLVLLSLALTAATLFSNISTATLKAGFAAAFAVGVVALTIAAARHALRRREQRIDSGECDPWLARQLGRSGRHAALTAERAAWRTPPLRTLPRPQFSRPRTTGLIVLRGYLAIALLLAIVKIARLAIAG